MIRFLWHTWRAQRAFRRWRRQYERTWDGHIAETAETWGAEASLSAQQDRWHDERAKTHTN
jgi:hypothetical protein